MTDKIFNDRQIYQLFATLAEQQDFVFLDTSMADGMNRESLLFTEPVARLQHCSGEDRQAYLDRTAEWLGKGYFLAGWLGYEFMHDELSLDLKDNSSKLADLGVYPPPLRFDHDTGANDFPPLNGSSSSDTDYLLTNLQPAVEEQQYCQAIRTILEYIAAGDTYQVNYTFKLHFDFNGSVPGFYRDLRRSQPVPYGCFIRNGDHYTLSFSPELFFHMDAGRIMARPMKGTMKRGRMGNEDQAIATRLHKDVKNRAENVMIVDLLRNDLSRLVESTGGGRVGVDSLFDVERYRTVFQMTSTVVARRFQTDSVSPAQILEAIFPCGSVTGAPKIRTMEIIDELEIQPRGVYTGTIGYFSPDNKAVFNVPIRTVVIDAGKGEMGIGSGIVADSSPQDEWCECLLKARFLTNPPPRFDLIETMLYDPRHGYLFVDEHINRMMNSADYLGLVCDEGRVRTTLDELAAGFTQTGCKRVRLTISNDGETVVESGDCDQPGALSLTEARAAAGEPEVLIDFSEMHTDSSSPWLFHKTTRRGQYDMAYRQACSQGLADLIFCNERSEITEGAISNIVVEKNGDFFTPPLECGLLAGVMRTNLLRDDAPINVTERILYKEDLLAADQLYICNSVRGVVPVRLRT